MTKSTNSNENSGRSPRQADLDLNGPIDTEPTASVSDSSGVNLSVWGPRLLVAIGWLALFPVLDLGWVPLDDGALAHSADRVNAGQVPHRDFQDLYTGGLSYLNALALSWLGGDLLSLRIPLWILAGAWAGALFGLARRVLEPFHAAVATVLLASVPLLMHLTPMPSWYNLFFGTFALLGVVRFAESLNRWWLFASGLMIGVGTLAKPSALLFAVGVGATLAVRAIRTGYPSEVRVGRALLLLGVGALTLVISPSLTLNRVVVMVVPFVLVVAALWTPAASGGKGSSVLAEVSRVALGMALPLAAFFCAYWTQGAARHLGDWLVSVGATLRILDLDAPNPAFALFPAVLWLVVVRWTRDSDRLSVPLVVAFVGTGLVLYAAAPNALLLWGFMTLVILPSSVGWFAGIMWRRAKEDLPLSLIAIVMGALVFALIAFPTFHEHYAFYALPLSGLAVLGIASTVRPVTLLPLLIILATFSAGFVVGKLEGRWMSLGSPLEPRSFVELSMPRGGLRVQEQFAYYNDLISRVVASTNENESILAGPDAPEVYFLSGRGDIGWALFPGLAVRDPGPTFTESLANPAIRILVRNQAPFVSGADVPDLSERDHVLLGVYHRFEVIELR